MKKSFHRFILGTALGLVTGLATAADAGNVPSNPAQPIPAPIPQSEPPPPPPVHGLNKSTDAAPPAIAAQVDSQRPPMPTPSNGPMARGPNQPDVVQEPAREKPAQVRTSPSVATSQIEKERWCEAAEKRGLAPDSCKSQKK